MAGGPSPRLAPGLPPRPRRSALRTPSPPSKPSSSNRSPTLDPAQTLLAGVNAQVRARRRGRGRQGRRGPHRVPQHGSLTRTGAGGYATQRATAPPASSTVAATALAAAKALSGHPYQWGGTGPVGYDCSGMTGAAYAAAGIHLPRTVAQQYQSGPHVPLADLPPGELLFWASNPADPATIEHDAMYAGNGLMMSANHTGDVTRLQPVWWNGYAGATPGPTRPRPSPPPGRAGHQQSPADSTRQRSTSGRLTLIVGR